MDEFIERKTGGAAKIDQRSLARQDVGGHPGNFRCNGDRHGVDAVKIAMKQVAGGNLQSIDFNGLAEVGDVRVGMRYDDAGRKQVEASFPDGWKITDNAVGDAADAIERERDLRMNLTHACADSG